MKTFKLNNGVEIPALGLGTFPMNGKSLVLTTVKSFIYGYRSFDSASAYHNEKHLGIGLKLCLTKRTNYFVTTKLSNKQQRTRNVKESLLDSLNKLGLKYVDLYLMHWPNPDTYLESWKEMELLYKQGYCRAIGVCNFHKHHIEKLLEVAEIIPAINQIELHPLLSQKSLVEYCTSLGIQVQSYSPLARMNERLIKNPTLIELAKKYNKTVPQIILRWNYQNGIISIPKTQNPSRLKENLDIFNFIILDNDVKLIDDINCNYRVRYDPDNCDFTKI